MLDGETVKRGYCLLGLVPGALGMERAGGESDAAEDVGSGSSGKSSSHSYPVPERDDNKTVTIQFKIDFHLQCV